MPTEKSQLEHAIFSVCATGDVVEAATTACGELSASSFVGEFSDYFAGDRKPQFSEAVVSAAACTAVVDCDRDPELALATMERLKSLPLRNVSVVATATKVEAAYLVRAMRLGCNEFLHKPLDLSALTAALRRLQSVSTARAHVQQSNGRVLTFLGAKGGVGTTTLAVHLAHNLAKAHNRRVLLIDHHHELGHVALYLGLSPGQYSFDELLRNADRLDADLLNGFVMRHPSGLHVLASPDRCAATYRSGREEMHLVLGFLKSQYDFVLLDSITSQREAASTVVESSDETYLVATPDIAALRDLARHAEHLAAVRESGGRLRVVINRSTKDDSINPDQIAEAVRLPVWLDVSASASEVVRAVNAGEPLSPQHRSAFAQQMNRWSVSLLAQSDEIKKKDAPRSSGLRFWRSKQQATA